MRRFLALILALAMTLSAVMPSVALAYDSADTSGSSSITEQSSEASSEEASASKSSASEPEPEPEQPAPEAEPEDEPEQPAPEAEPEAEPEQSGDAESEPESSKDGSLYADTSESAPEEAPVLRQHTLRSTLKTVDGVRYQVTVAYDDTAEIPKGTRLSIVELNQELSEQEQKLPENQKRPYKTEEFVTEKALEQESFDLLQGLEVRDKDLVLFTKFLDLELKKDGRTIQPKSAVTVTVETDVVEEGASDALEVALYNAQATLDWQKERKKLEEEQQKKIKSGKLKEEDAKRFPEKVYTTMLLTNETQKKKGVKLSFEAEELARMGVCAVGGELKTWKHKGEQVSVFGPRSLETDVKRTSMKTPKDGLEKMGGFSVELKEKEKPDYDVTFWVGRRPNASAVETQADSVEDAGVAAYTLKNGKTKKELLSPGTSEPAAIEAGDKIGLVWDTGLRDRTLEAEQVTLSGLLPKRAHVETNDMLWRYSRPEALSEDVQQGDAATLAAYDISIENRGAEYQPEADNPVTVRIQAAGIDKHKKLQVWHLVENDAVEVIENFQVHGDTISFEADSFSVYLVVEITKEQILTAEDGQRYKVTVTYDDDAGIPEDAQLQVSELTEGSEYNKYVKKAAKKLGTKADELTFAHAFDISLVNPETGEHYQPAKPVAVNIQLLTESVKEDSSVNVVHFGDKTEVLDSRISGDSVEFETDGFSVYVVVCTTLEQTLTASDGNEYLVTVTYDNTSGIPSDAELSVSEIKEGEAGYEEYVAQSAAALGEKPENLAFARPFDITLKNAETGEEYQPNKDVKVTIELLKDSLDNYENIDVVHIPDGVGEHAQVMDTAVHGESVEFETDGFSVYVLCAFTVDFHWGEYTYSIAGESEITLSALLENLGVEEITVADVAEVAFSDPTLVEVETIKDEAEQTTDWLLKSLAPFSTEEKLTLTLKNGKTVEIKVTDVDYNVYNNSNAVIGSWTLDSEGVLTVTATGAMKDYNDSPWVGGTPWFDYIVKDSTHSDPPVTKIVITDGITRIGTNSFTRTYNLNEIDASNCTSLTTIGGSAFKQQSSSSASNNMANPKIIIFSGCESLTTIETDAFRDCKGIEELDISGTKLKADYITTASTGFGSGKNTLKILKANGCTTSFTSLNLGGWISLQTVELSGCTNLTSLTLPSNVTTLDVSGCTSLTSLTVPSSVTTLNVSGCTNLTSLTLPSNVTTLNVSGCTGLTSLTVPNGVTSLNVSGCTGLNSLNIPSSVTTLNASGCTGLTELDVSGCTGLTTLNVSGCTGLTSLNVPASAKSLNASGCTGLTALDLSGTSLTNIDVSNNASLTALKLPATVTALNITDCPNLVIFFDGKAEDLPDGILAGASVVCWGDYTYAIKKNTTAALDEIFTALGITAIGSTDVQSISVSESSVLKVTDLTVTCLDAFTDTQALTVTLKNGLTGNISVECQMVAEKDNLNLFLDSGTVYSYEGKTDTHRLSEPAIVKDGDKLNLTLSFSEIPEGQEGERQMKLSAPMEYTFPAGLTVVDVPSTVTINIQGEETLSFNASVAFNQETHVLTITGNYDNNQTSAVSAATAVSFTVPVTVQPSKVPSDYDLGYNLTLSAVKPHNVKVTSFTSGNYDAASGTIQYTVTVEAESDLDFDGKEYPVIIKDSATGAIGTYTYAHKDGFVLPEGKPATQVNGADVEPGVATSFTGLPLTVEHMYEGDRITLTYTAKPQHGSYDKDTRTATAENTVTITNKDALGNPNPSNSTEDDTASAVTENIPYSPLTREYVNLDGSWAYWRVTVNPDGYALNDGNAVTLADTFDDDYPTKETKTDANQSIDYSSIKITSTGSVTYDYSGNTGTFVIPDNTPVTITYRTRITAQPGERKTFRGTARLRDGDGNEIASATAGKIEGAVIYPSASDVTGSGNYMVKLYVYGEGQMQKGIKGATFILLDANQRPLEYKLGDNKGQPVTFTTGDDGYANIELHEEPGDVSIEKNTGYYLEMIKVVKGYQKDNTLYSFMITDDPDYNSGGFYTYYNGDTMKVRLYAPTPGLSVSIRFSGSYALRQDQKDAVVAVLQKLENEQWVEVERHPYTDSQWGAIKFEKVLYDASLGDFQNIYRVVEENQSPWDLPENIHLETTYYCVREEDSDPKKEPQEFFATSANDSVNVVIDNRYEDPQLTIVKMDKSTGEVLPGAEFSVYKIVNGTKTGDAVETYTTDENGEIVVRGDEHFSSETLYGITETKTLDGYLLPQQSEWRYFYFCNDDYLEPTILANLPAGETAINLTGNGDKITIDNQKEKITIPVMKLWQGNKWPENTEVVVGLYRSVEGVEGEEAVKYSDGTLRTTTLTSAMPYNNTAFKDLPSRDDQNRNYIYSIKEESVNGIDPLKAGYNQEYGISSAGVYIVRNKPATTLTVKKEWYDFQGNKVEVDRLAAQSPVTFDVYRSSEKFTDSDPSDGITNADMTAFVSKLVKVREKQSFGAEDNWSMSIRDLDKQDDMGNPYYYYVLENIPSFGNELYVINEDTGAVTIQNKIAPTTVNLTVTKAPLVEDPRQESLNSDFQFTLKLKKDDTHPIRSWQVYTDEEHPENNLVTDWNGEAVFTLKPTDPDQQTTEGASITLSLPAGVTATVTEADNPEYTVETAALVAGTTADNGRTFTYEVNDTDVTLTYTNTLHVVCKVVDDNGNQTPFESLKSALKHIHENPGLFTAPWTIYMLEDYTIPVTDGIDLAEGESLTLTTAAKDDPLFPFKGGEETGRAVITRGGVGGSMLKNAGTLTLENIVLDGAKKSFTATGDGGLVHSTGTLNLNENTVLCNSATEVKGGAVYAEGVVNIVDGVKITGNSAPSASALYLKGTLNMTGGSITENTGASDGAVVVEDTIDRINLSDSPVIFNNTNAQKKAANLYIGVDSDNVVNVVKPGLSENAKIGVTAMDGHMAIGEQFASAEFEQTEHLNRFVNDEYGYRGKLKDGTTTNIVWDGLTIKIKKTVDPLGANSNDRFTITLSSMSIVMSTYIIDGTLDYTVSAARQNRPGRITLRNVKADDEITISPLPVGNYTIAESASNYAPVYTIVETGSGDTPTNIEGGTFYAENDSNITVTNTRRLAKVKLTKTLDDRLKATDETQDFGFTVKLTEADGTAVSGFKLAEGVTTKADGVADFTMSPSNAAEAIREFKAPVGATMTITETIDPNYEITASAKTMPEAGEGAAITDADTDNDNIFTFPVTDNGADVTFANVRKMAQIELRKNLTGKVSKTESFTYTVTLTRADGQSAAGYVMYRDNADTTKNITTGEDGKATIILSIGRDESTKAILLTIPEGTKLVVAETEVKKTVGNAEQLIYDTKYSINGAAETTGLKATIDPVSDNDHSIVFNNTRKTNTIVVKNTVSGYSGNVVPFTYTATVTDWVGENPEDTKPEGYDDYDLNGFTNGTMTFELTTGQTRTLTVPYGATLKIVQKFIVGYDTTIQRGSASSKVRTIEFMVNANETIAFTNTQLIALVLKNECSHDLTASVNVSVSNLMYRVNDAQDDYIIIPLTNKTGTVMVEAGKTATLEVTYNEKQTYTVSGSGPYVGYYYTIKNEPAYHEDAKPSFVRVYDTGTYSVTGNLKYGPADSYLQYTEQPMVSFDSNGGAWTTEMDGYRDRDGNRKVYQKAVDKGKKVARPTPDPVYPTAENIPFLGWTTHEDFAKAGHQVGEDISANAYNFNTPVTAPFTLYAVWAKPARSTKIVTLKNSTGNKMNLSLTLVNSSRVGKITLADSVVTDDSGKANIELNNGDFINLSIPDSTKLVIGGIASGVLSISEEFADSDSEETSYTIASVQCDGTVTFGAGVCKITDVDGNVLNDNGKPAVYGKLSEAFNAYPSIADAAYVKMLVDEYTIQQSNTLTFPNKTMTLTTAGKNDSNFPYMGNRDQSTIYRYDGGNSNSCFTLTGGNITIKNLILDGGSERNATNGKSAETTTNGALIKVTGGTLNINTGATMRNSAFKAYTDTNYGRGGAIYISGGTLNVYAGLFTNLHARRGGAICAESNASLNITSIDEGLRFEDCTAESDSGGAIYYSVNKAITVNGGVSLAQPGIVFERCSAIKEDNNANYGGAIYIGGTQATEISGCAFTECIVRAGKEERRCGGGGIGVYNSPSLLVKYCSFRSCDSIGNSSNKGYSSGGGVFGLMQNNQTATIDHCTFDFCNGKGQGGSLAVYPSAETSATKTKLVVNDSKFNNSTSGMGNGSGGAIQTYTPYVELHRVDFENCLAAKEGGAMNHVYGGTTADNHHFPSGLIVDHCHFKNCRAEDRYKPTEETHYGGAICTRATIVTVNDSSFENCVSTLREGGALYCNGRDKDTSGDTADRKESLTTIKNTTFKDCSANTFGGALLTAANSLVIDENTSFVNCTSNNNGGAVAHRQGRGSGTPQSTSISNTSFVNCTAYGTAKDKFNNEAYGGGALWTRAVTVSITDCTIDNCTAAKNGGAVYLFKQSTSTGTITDGSITNCQAESGSAVYVGDSATFSGNLNISGNTVSTLNGGAIQTADAATTQPDNAGKLYFEGDVKVENNTCSVDSVNKHDVLMQIDGNTIINTTSVGLGSGAHIGVYVSDPNSAYANHGQYDQPFGTYDNSNEGSSYLDGFFNDRDSVLYGYQGDDAFIHWGFYVCKITDADGKTLKRTNGRDAVYQRLTQAIDEFTSVKNESEETGKAVYIKMLVEDYAIRQEDAISDWPAADITLTTASKSDTRHPYCGTAGTVCTIYRANSENPLFSVDTANAVFQLKDITLDGRKTKTATKGDYKLITASDGEIIVNSGTTLQYAKGNTGAAISGTTVKINGSVNDRGEATVKISNCTATGNGGAISAQSLTITKADNTPGCGTSFVDCTATGNGGAVSVSGSTMSITGALFQNCRSTSEGGAVCHSGATSSIFSSFFTNCNAEQSGGAVSSQAWTLTVAQSTFDSCNSKHNGGAINHTGTNSADISGTTFKACQTNGAYGFGGSVYTGAKEVALTGGSFRNSTAANHGGALYCASTDDDSAATISGTSFESCSTTLTNGDGGAIYANGGTLTLKNAEDKTAVKIDGCMTSTANGAAGRGGAVYMNAGVLNVTENTVISNCYADKGGAIYLPADVTMNITDSPEFSQNGFTTINGRTVDASEGACIYLAEDGRINFKDSPKFSRNILPNRDRITNGGVTDFVRQDVYLAGYASSTAFDTNAASIYVVGDLTGDTIWVWPEQSPHKQPNEQFAKIENGVTVGDDTLSHFRNALSDGESGTGCSNGEYLAGVQVGTDAQNVYWDKMYAIEFRKKDNKGVAVPGAEFRLYKDRDCTIAVATAVSADGETDTGAQGNLLARGTVEFTSIRIGAYYMKETKVPASFKENNATYLVLVGTPYLAPYDDNKHLWEGDGPLNVTDAATLVPRHTTDAGKYYGIFPLDENNKVVLRANLASSNVGIENIRNDYQVSFMKVDSSGAALPGAAFTIYTAILDSNGQPDTFEDGYPKMMLWSRDGENYPAPVVSADGTNDFKDVNNKKLQKGMVYFRELPLGTYYLLETAYPERNGNGRRTFYLESERVFRLKVTEDPNNPGKAVFTLSEWQPATEEGSEATYKELPQDVNSYYVVSNQEVVCKLTDGSDKLLYTQGHEVWDNKTEASARRLFPAIYATLEAGFADAQNRSFVYADGTEANVDAIKLKVLKDFTLTEPILYNSNRDITFTTAETRVSKDRYIFNTTRTTDTSRALITRAYNADTSADANAGALITLASGADMTLQHIRLNGDRLNADMPRNGRAIRVTEESSLTVGTSTRIEYFKQEASANSTDTDLKGGAILMEGGTSLSIDGGYNRTAIFAYNEVNNERTEGNTGSDGGAIAVGANCTFNITNAQFSRNNASATADKKGNGGAISINKTKDATEQAKLPIHNVVFTHNTASYKGGAIRTAENCDLTVSNCTFNTNTANSGEGGAIAVLSKKDKPSTLTINSGTVFTRNTAESGGAVRIGGYGTLRLDKVTMSSNTASGNGGAVSAAPGANVTMESGTISSNTASGNGGAFYVEGDSTTSTETAEGGEGATGTDVGFLTISGGSITGNNARLGSAIYAADYAKATVTNASITGNKAGETNGGAINVGGNNARLYFGGAPTVFDNFGTTDPTQQKNLVLSEDSNAVINTTADGLTDGVIGVYVTETVSDDSTVFEKHGLPGKPFGTFGDSGHLKPQVFRSDHALALYGVKNENDSSDETIYWVDVICKLTDVNDKILYQDIKLKISGKEEIRKGQAVYARITDSNTDAVENGFNALRDGFDAAQDTLYSKNGASYNAIQNSYVVKLKMLQDYDLEKGIVHSGRKHSVVFTTAEMETGLTQDMKANGDFFSYRGRKKEDGTFTYRKDENENNDARALITRAFANVSMIQASGQDLRVTDIVLDGAKDSYSATVDGGIVHVNSGGSLTVTNGAALQNSATTGNGGAVYVAAGGTATVSGGTINGNTAANGAGIYLDWNSADNHAVLKLAGNPSFGGTDRKGGDGDDKDDLKGTEGNFVRMDSSFKTEDKEPTNGGKQYPKDSEGYYLVRQDIYIPGTAQPHNAICVTGNITSGDGTIWIWAEKVNHYEMLKQFAVFDGDGTSLSDERKDSSLRAFRNAQPDSLTNCGGDYLTGQRGEDINGYQCIYWTGGFDVVFLKTDAYGGWKIGASGDKISEGLPGAVFTLYTDEACTTPYIMTFTSGTGQTTKSAFSTSSDGTATYKDKNGSIVTLKKGEVLLSKVPPKTFYLKETTHAAGYNRDENLATIYQVTISDKGELTMMKKDANGDYTEEVYKEKRGEVTDNSTTTDPIQYVVMNIPEAERKVILRKVNSSYASLKGAEFEILRYDRTPVSGKDISGNTTTTFTSGDSGVYFIGELPFGTYYLHEKKVPTGYQTVTADGNWFILTVNENGAGYQATNAGTVIRNTLSPETSKPG